MNHLLRYVKISKFRTEQPKHVFKCSLPAASRFAEIRPKRQLFLCASPSQTALPLLQWPYSSLKHLGLLSLSKINGNYSLHGVFNEMVICSTKNLQRDERARKKGLMPREKRSYVDKCQESLQIVYLKCIAIQGDPSGLSKPIVDIDVKVAF